MTESASASERVEDALFSAVCACLGVDETTAAAQRRVRRSWPAASDPGALPGFSRAENVCFLRVTPADEPYAAFTETQREYDASADALCETLSRCDAHAALLVFYGPRAAEDARLVRDGLASESVRRVLRRKKLYLTRPPAAPRRVPELSGGRWWERCDLALTLYQAASRTQRADYFASAQVQTKGVTDAQS
ncbi:MAG: hypothetical protein PUK79_04860 [Clostridiales bacterium]|nr:hypothetical protein [Clostridiales bacterium]